MATKFSSDTATTPSEKNGKLAELLETSWNNLKVEKVERIDTADTKGWKVTYND